jgi:hypothetical protein
MRAEAATSWLVSNNIKLINTGTNQPVATEGDGDDPAAEMRRTYALLRDPEVDVAEIAAQRIARQHGFWYVLQQVFSWRHAVTRGKALAPGAIVNRLDSGWRADDLTPEDIASELFQRHAAEVYAARQAAAAARRYSQAPAPQADAAALRRRYGKR